MQDSDTTEKSDIEREPIQVKAKENIFNKIKEDFS